MAMSGIVSRWVVLQAHDVEGGVRDDTVERWVTEARDAYLDQCHELREMQRSGLVLRTRYGAPVAEGPEPIRAEWKNKAERAVLTAEQGRRRASLLVSRGTFEEDLYKVR